MKSVRLFAAGIAGLIAVACLAQEHKTDKPVDLVKGMNDAKLTLGHAIKEAESSAKATAMGAHGQMNGPDVVVVVHVANDSGCKDVTIDKKGKASKTDDGTKDTCKMAHEMAGADVMRQMKDNKMSLGKAVEAAESASKGKAYSAHVEKAGADMQYEVMLVNGDKTQDVDVDKTGKVKEMETKDKDTHKKP